MLLFIPKCSCDPLGSHWAGLKPRGYMINANKRNVTDVLNEYNTFAVGGGSSKIGVGGTCR
jgi:hypothetical protein